MDQITEYITQIKTRDYNSQCKYIKKKLLSLTSSDISRIIFSKKLQVIFYNIPYHLSVLDFKIDEKNNYGLIFWDKLLGNTYFNDDKGIIQIKCVKLTNNMYQIKIPVTNTPIPIISYIITN